MRVIGTGPVVRLYVTRAELRAITARAEPGVVPVLPIAVPVGVPVFVNDYIDEAIAVCASEFPDGDDDWSRSRVYPAWQPLTRGSMHGKGGTDGE